MPFVLDASVALCWAFKDELTDLADAALERLRTDKALVPSIWWFEICNVLIVNERSGRISEPDSSVFLSKLRTLEIATDDKRQDADVLMLSRRHRLSVYDASYLEIARREGLALATLDRELMRAARAEHLHLLR
jgi:predicted nucleic acid-binding protein